MIHYLQAHSTNYRKGRNSNIKYIVIHYTANKGDTAKNNAQYFNRTANLYTSAHLFVDEFEVYQSVGVNDTAFAVGDGKGMNGITNDNSISIELCNFNTYNQAVAMNSIPIIRTIMKQFSIPIENVVRHYDASYKSCPLPFARDSQLWYDYKNLIKGSEKPLDITFIGKGKDMQIKIGDKLVKADMLINVKGNTIATSARDLLELIGHNVEWQEKA